MEEIYLNKAEKENLAKIVDEVKPDELLETLKEIARNIEINKRRDFEDTLLTLARNQKESEKRGPMYELFPSLEIIWHEHKPVKDLGNRYKALLKEGKTDEALRAVTLLTKQGLDFLGIWENIHGKLSPLTGEASPLLMLCDKNKIKILDVELNVKTTYEMPAGLTIIDVFPHRKVVDWESDTDSNVLVLLKDTEEGRHIFPLNLKEERHKEHSYLSSPDYKDYQRIARFQEHFLLISRHNILVYHENKEWTKWFSDEIEITAVETDEEKFWVGLSDGTGYVFRHWKMLGIRDKMDKHSGAIRNIWASHRFVAITSPNQVSVADTENTTVLNPVEIRSNAIASTILNDENIITINANGMLVGRSISRGNVLWRINLGDLYNSLFTLGNMVYCQQGNGKVVVFKIPAFSAIHKELAEKNALLTASPTTEWNPREPIRFLAKFIGRRNILEEIEKERDAHFLIRGIPGIGKTSLLLVLAEVLSGNSRCCYIPMEQILQEAGDSYDTFEDKFFSSSLSQHVFNKTDLDKKKTTIHQRVRQLVKNLKGDKSFCVFCLDNFPPRVPDGFTPGSAECYKRFLTEMFVMPEVRLIITCSEKQENQVRAFLKEVMPESSKERKLITRSLQLFSEMEVKGALREKVRYSPRKIQQIYDYIGRYPHLINLYDSNPGDDINISTYFEEMAQHSHTWICRCFKELSSNACILLATLEHENLISKPLQLNRFYQDFPLIKRLLPPEKLNSVLQELNNHLEGITAEPTHLEVEDPSYHKEPGKFKLSMMDAVLLFHEASKHVPWIKVLFALYVFCANPNKQNAEKFIDTKSEIVRIAFYDDQKTSELRRPFEDNFIIKWLTPDGRSHLGMPMETFLVIPLNPWKGDENLRRLRSLYHSIQNFLTTLIKSIIGFQVTSKFYLLYFDFLSKDSSNIKKETKGLDRVSIIDPFDIMKIILDKKPEEKSAQVIFEQLKISERSPYTFSGVVHDLFVGRDVEMALIRGLPENIGIFGSRTIGKTSLLLKLYKEIKDQRRWEVIALDCALIDSAKKLLNELAKKLKVDFSEISTREKFKYFITRQAESKKIQYLFLLDEVDGLVDYDTRNKEKIFKTFNQLCTEPIEGGGVAARFILFGFNKVYKHMKDPGSRLYNFMVFLPLRWFFLPVPFSV